MNNAHVAVTKKDKAITPQEFDDAMTAFDLPTDNPFIAIAVSGGGDSMAMALLMHDWVKAHKGRMIAFTVDHKLRSDSSAEAGYVQAVLQERGIEHEILTWTGDKPDTQIQEAARNARYNLMIAACKKHKCSVLTLAHNLEDQIETFWIRLSHGSGLDGLAAMSPERMNNGVRIIRPLLSFHRARLRATCTLRNFDWKEDPSNNDTKYLRVRLRQFESLLAGEGFTPERLSQTLEKLSAAREALETVAKHAAQTCLTQHNEGHATLTLNKWQDYPRDIRLRLLSNAMQTVYPQDYAAGYEAQSQLHDALFTQNYAGQTLAGCDIFPQRQNIIFCREAAPMEEQKPALPNTIWDRRFTIEHVTRDLKIGALGEDGLQLLKKERITTLDHLPFKIKKTLPALWDGKNLAAVPHADWYVTSTFKDNISLKQRG